MQSKYVFGWPHLWYQNLWYDPSLGLLYKCFSHIGYCLNFEKNIGTCIFALGTLSCSNPCTCIVLDPSYINNQQNFHLVEKLPMLIKSRHTSFCFLHLISHHLEALDICYHLGIRVILHQH